MRPLCGLFGSRNILRVHRPPVHAEYAIFPKKIDHPQPQLFRVPKFDEILFYYCITESIFVGFKKITYE